MAKKISTLEKIALGTAAVIGSMVLYNAIIAAGYYIDKKCGGNGINGAIAATIGYTGLVCAGCSLSLNRRKSRS